MQHPDEGTIHSWLDGALSAEEAALVEEHVKDCPQCAAAVAEARGFIAASSRILTALDNAPRGVIPAAAPKKRVDPIVWRIAATLLVVAGGTLAVLRSGGREAPITVTDSTSGGSSAVTAVAPQASAKTMEVAPAAPNGVGSAGTTVKAARPMSLPGSPPRAVAGGNGPQDAFSRKGVAKMGAVDMPIATANAPAVPSPSVVYSAPAAAPSSANRPPALYGKAAGRAENTAKATMPTPQLLSPAAVSGIAALDALSEPRSLKIVGTARQIGVKTTLYEVAPGDTVTLIEMLGAQLESVVVTGLSTARTADQSTQKSVSAPAAKTAVAPTVSAPDSQRAAQTASAAAAPALQAQTGNVLASRVSTVQVANGVTTISWSDPATGNAMKLSGRMPPARLQAVRIQIERERAAEAAKKKP
jgi:anti-sigma factor RsiW